MFYFLILSLRLLLLLWLFDEIIPDKFENAELSLFIWPGLNSSSRFFIKALVLDSRLIFFSRIYGVTVLIGVISSYAILKLLLIRLSYLDRIYSITSFLKGIDCNLYLFGTGLSIKLSYGSSVVFCGIGERTRDSPKLKNSPLSGTSLEFEFITRFCLIKSWFYHSSFSFSSIVSSFFIIWWHAPSIFLRDGELCNTG